MKVKIYKIILFSFFALVNFTSQNVYASTVSLNSPNTSFGIGEQFYVDLMLDTEGKNINGIEGKVLFSEENISFVRAEEGKSLIDLWVEKPKLDKGGIIFSGIISSGFEGVIDPFNPNKKLPGLIIRLVFESKQSGITDISSFGFFTTLSDGLGTVDNIPSSKTSITIQNIHNPYVYKITNNISPELSAYVTRDKNLFNNKYTLVYKAKDSQTGIKEVLIKEGRRKWKKIESPYLLEDQSRHSIITVQATNYSGSSIAVSIDRIPYKIFSVKNISIAIFIIFVLLFVSKKIYEKYK